MTISFLKFLFRLTFAWLGLVLLGTFLFGIETRKVSGQQDSVSYIDELRVKELNDTAINLIQASNIGRRIGIRAVSQGDELMKVLQERKELLSNLIEKDPALALQNAALKTYRSQIPATLQGYVELDFRGQDRVEVAHIDDFEKNTSRYDYFLGSNQDRETLYFPNNQPQMISGTQINVQGVELGNKVAVSNFRIQSSEPLADTLGEQKTLLIIVNFPQDKRIQKPYWKKEVKKQVKGCMFTDNKSANKFYQEASFNKVLFSGDMIGPYTIPFPTDYKKCNFSYILDEAIKAADKDVNFSNYSRLVIPVTSCIGGGQGTVGKWDLLSQDGQFSASVTWINLEFYNSFLLSHELGHNLGLWHAHSLNCTGKIIDDLRCEVVEYGDIFDVMGSGGKYKYLPTHINASYKEYLKWIPKGIIADKSGIYEIAPIEIPSSLPQILKIPKGRSSWYTRSGWYTLEYRQPLGFDNLLSDGLKVRSALIRFNYSKSSNETYLLNDVLKPGQIFNDPRVGISIKHINQTPEKLTVEIGGELMAPLSGPTTTARTTGQVSPLGVKTSQESLQTSLLEQQQPPPIFQVELSPSVSSGKAPLIGVDLNAQVTANTQGSISYTFYCNRSDTGTNVTSNWNARFDSISEFSKKAQSLCIYPKAGKYTPKVIVEQGDLAAQAQATIMVEELKLASGGAQTPSSISTKAKCNFSATPDSFTLIFGKQISSTLSWDCENVRPTTCYIQSPVSGPQCGNIVFPKGSCPLSPFKDIGQYVYHLTCQNLNETYGLYEAIVKVKAFLYETR